MQPLKPKEIEEAKARRPAAAPEEIEQEAIEYQERLAEYFTQPRLSDPEQARDASPLGPSAAPDELERRIDELHYRLFEMTDRGTTETP